MKNTDGTEWGKELKFLTVGDFMNLKWYEPKEPITEGKPMPERRMPKITDENGNVVPVTPTIPPKVNMHDIICDELHETYIKKNADYGDSFAELRNRLPNAILVRMFDKYLRIETLLTGAEAQVKDESIEDSLLDLANYCIMEVIERRMEAEDGKEI